MRSGRSSLRRKLPGWIALILTIAIGIYGAIAYGAVRRADVENAQRRLRSVTTRLAELSRTSIANRLARFQQIASDSTIVEAFLSPERATGALAALMRAGPDTGAAVATMLQDPAGKTILALDRDVKALLAERTDSARTSPLVERGDSILVEFSVPVHDGPRLVGHLVQIRTVRAGPAAIKTVAELVGTEARIVMGNKDGSLWTDLLGVVDPPPQIAGETRYQRDGQYQLLATEPVAGTPLIFGVEFPENRVLARSQRLLAVFVSIGAVVVAAGILLGWIVTRRITVPLANLTSAAETLAAGDADIPDQPLVRDDEIGRLDLAFRAMAKSVNQSREDLERQVAERTRALESTRDALVRKERMAVLGQLASSVGHELRNPLGVISNVAYYLSATLKDSPAKVTNQLTMLSHQVNVAEKIISDILDFTRVKQPEISDVAVDGFVEEQIQRIALPTGIRIDRNIEADLPAIQVDRIQMGQVIFNLLTNAVQAMEGKGGRLIVRARADNGRVRIEIEDDGPGIDGSHLDRIFEPLFTTKTRGFGLGLSISRSLATANGASLTAANGPNGGAVFAIEVPAVGVPA